MQRKLAMRIMEKEEETTSMDMIMEKEMRMIGVE
jgi:hypothetical protein